MTVLYFYKINMQPASFAESHTLNSSKDSSSLPQQNWTENDLIIFLWNRRTFLKCSTLWRNANHLNSKAQPDREALKKKAEKNPPIGNELPDTK